MNLARQPDVQLKVSCLIPGSQQIATVPWSKLKIPMPTSANVNHLLMTDQIAPTISVQLAGNASKVTCNMSLTNIGNKEALDVALYSFPIGYTIADQVHFADNYDPKALNLEPSIGAATGMNLAVVPLYDLTNRPTVISFSLTPIPTVTNALFLVNLSGTNIPAHLGYLRVHFTR